MLKCNRYLHIGSRLISWKLRQNCLIATSSCSYSTECSQQNGADVIYDIVISGGGMVGSAMAAALGIVGQLYYLLMSGSRVLSRIQFQGV